MSAVAVVMLAIVMVGVLHYLVKIHNAIQAIEAAQYVAVVDMAIEGTIEGLARDIDSIEEQVHFDRIRRAYKPGGPSVPSLWLTDVLRRRREDRDAAAQASHE